MKRDDPKVKKLRAARNAAMTRVEVLTKGIARTLENGYWLEMEELQPILDIINNELVAAVKQYEAATEAYRPFMSRRRVHKFRPRKAA